MEVLKNPLYNAIISGIIIYLLIHISNRGNPVLGAILSSLPIGLFSLIAIRNKNNIKKFYIRSELVTNLIIIIMWVAVNYMIIHMDNINHISLIAFFIWIGLSTLFYYTAMKFIPT